MNCLTGKSIMKKGSFIHSSQGKLLAFAFCFILVWNLLYIQSFAYTPAIKSIQVHVALQQDGSAVITQVWDVTVADGTEYYIPQTNLGDMEIKNFTVSDETGKEFVNVGTWDINKSLEEKAGKCGINPTSEGLELCWGVGSYGDHKYTLRYTLTNLIKAYPDFDGFNSRFINDSLSSTVEAAKVIIEKPGRAFTPEEVRMWAFGYQGDIYLVDGKIVATASSPLQSYNHMTIMTSYQKGLFQPLSSGTGSFEDVKKTAFQGSSYDISGEGGPSAENSDSDGSIPGQENPGSGNDFNVPLDNGFTMDTGFFWVFAFIFGGAWLGLLGRRKNSPRKNSISMDEGLSLPSYEDVGYYRDVPCNGNISGCLHGLSMLQSVKENDILSAYILRWIKLGAIQVKKATRPRFLGFGEVEESSLVMVSSNPLTEDSEKKLYSMMRSASGTDGVLQEKEFTDWSRSNYEQLRQWFDDEYFAGKLYFKKINASETVQKSAFFNLMKYTEEALNKKGVEIVSQIMGFKKYLTDFTLINERESKEVQLWDDYLIFAALYGMAHKVSQEMKELYPEFTRQSVYYNSNSDMFTTLMMVNAISNAGHSGMQSGMNSASSSSGFGGSSSFGGGGGFSGGGSGGGSR